MILILNTNEEDERMKNNTKTKKTKKTKKTRRRKETMTGRRILRRWKEKLKRRRRSR